MDPKDLISAHRYSVVTPIWFPDMAAVSLRQDWGVYKRECWADRISYASSWPHSILVQMSSGKEFALISCMCQWFSKMWLPARPSVDLDILQVSFKLFAMVCLSVSVSHKPSKKKGSYWYQSYLCFSYSSTLQSAKSFLSEAEASLHNSLCLSFLWHWAPVRAEKPEVQKYTNVSSNSYN